MSVTNLTKEALGCEEHLVCGSESRRQALDAAFLKFFTKRRHELGAYQPANVLPR